MRDRLLLYIYAVVFFVCLLMLGSLSQASNLERLKTISMIREIAEQEGVNPDLAVAIATVESELNSEKIGGLGEVGLFQLRPEFHKVKRGNVKANIRTAMRYLRYIQTKCEPKYDKAWFICYNLGPNYSRLKYPKLFRYYVDVNRAMNHVAMGE